MMDGWRLSGAQQKTTVQTSYIDDRPPDENYSISMMLID